jgi:endonuclease/exonuclease/phosphatase family metal-dependent hydrolase
MSCNLFNGRADPESLRAVLAEHSPDVVAAQELAPNAARVLEDVYRYGKLDPDDNHWGKGIALRYQGLVEDLPMAFRRGQKVLLDPSSWPALGRALQVVNVHLINPLERPWSTTRAIRREQASTVVQSVGRSNEALIIVGDFNATPVWPLYRRLIRVVRDGVRDTGNTHPTWGPFASGPRLLRIDHAFVQGGARVNAAETVRIKGSDHSGLLVEVSTD